MMPHAIALAIACFIRLAFENLTERFICLVLEEFALVGNPAEQAIGDQLLARAGLIRERPQRMVESPMPAEDCLLIGQCGLCL
jgi:hypothetical protein